MSFALQQTTQTVSSLSFAFQDLPIGPGRSGNSAETEDKAVKTPPRDLLSEAAKVAEKAAVVIDALQAAVDDFKQSDRDTLRGVSDYQRLGQAQQARAERSERSERSERPEGSQRPDRRENNSFDFEAIRQRISETTIQGDGFSASLYRSQSVSIGPEGRTAESVTFGEISLEVDDFDVEISFNQSVSFDEESGFASAERFGEITISGDGFEATLGFAQNLELGPDGPSGSSGRFAEFSIESDGLDAQFAFQQVAGFNPSGIFVSSQAEASVQAESESGSVAIEVFRQLEAYLGRNDEQSDQSLLSIG